VKFARSYTPVVTASIALTVAFVSAWRWTDLKRRCAVTSAATWNSSEAMKRNPPRKKGTPVGKPRWPGAGSRGVRKAIVTVRNKKVKVTLAEVKR
jgi:hypothetical protein